MRKYLLSLSLVAASAMLLVSCSKDDGDENPDGSLEINYAVQVVPVGNTQKGLSGATVTIQHNGETRQATTNADGIAVFENVKAGQISGNVTASGYASLNYTAGIAKTNIDANTVDYATSTIYMVATNGALKARAYGDFNYDGIVDITDNGDFTTVNAFVFYTVAGYPMGVGTGSLNTVSLDTDVYGATSTPAGVINFSNLPVTHNGYFSAQFYIADVSAIENDITIVYNYGPTGVTLLPGTTVDLGDVLMN